MAAGIKNRKEGRSWQTHYDRKAPRVGDIAPDFERCGWREPSKVI
jgi:hypothetical protein